MPKLTIDIEARLASFQDSLDKVGKQGDLVAKRLESAFGGFKSVIAAVGVTLSAGAVAAFAKAGIDAADSIGKAAQRIGVSTEALSAFQYAARLSDVEAQSLTEALGKLAKAASDTAAGTGESRDAWRALGISVTDANGRIKGTEELLTEVAERFSKLEDSGAKTALAMRVFGESGAKLIPFLNLGRAGLADLRKEAEQYGIVISGETARAAEKFNDDMTRLATAADGAKFAIAQGLLPALTRMSEQLAESVKQGQLFRGVWEALKQLSPATDLQKAQKELSELTDELLASENQLARRSGRIPREEEQALTEYIDRTKRRIDEVRKLLGVLRGETDAFGDPVKAPVPKERAPQLPNTGELQKLEAERRRLIELGDAQWIKAIEERFAREQQIVQDEIELDRKRAEEATKVQEQINEGWVKYAEEQIRIYEDQLRMEAAVADAAAKTKSVGEELGLTFSSAFEDAIVRGEKFRDVLKGIGQDVARILLRKSVTEPIAGGISDLFKSSGGGNLLSSIGSSFAKLLGFASGGSFTVGGGGGTDSQVVAFRATPGERVTVETPAQQRGGGGTTIINQFVDISGQIRDQIARATPAIVDAAVAQVANLRRRGVAI